MKRQFFWVGIGLAAGLALVVALTAAGIFSPAYTYKGSQIDPPFTAPEIAMQDVNGEPFQLSGQKGRVVMVFFGYTNCPDICPTTLAALKQARKALAGQASQMEVVFISVDPQRDSPERMRDYLSAFDSTFVGITGTTQALEPLWQAYGVYEDAHNASSDHGYLVDHSTRVYLVDPQGDLRFTYPYGVSGLDMASDVRQILKGR